MIDYFCMIFFKYVNCVIYFTNVCVSHERAQACALFVYFMVIM